MINEEIIIRQMKEGNQLAFTLLFNEYSKQVYSLAFKYLYNRELAEDVVQNVFFKIWLLMPLSLPIKAVYVSATKSVTMALFIFTSPIPDVAFRPKNKKIYSNASLS